VGLTLGHFYRSSQLRRQDDWRHRHHRHERRPKMKKNAGSAANTATGTRQPSFRGGVATPPRPGAATSERGAPKLRDTKGFWRHAFFLRQFDRLVCVSYILPGDPHAAKVPDVFSIFSEDPTS